MDQFTFERMSRNLEKHQYEFCRLLDAIELVRRMGNTLPDSSQGRIRAAHTNKSPYEGMDEFIYFVKKKKSAMECFRKILEDEQRSDLLHLLEEGVGASARSNSYQTASPPRASSQQQTTQRVTTSTRHQTSSTQRMTRGLNPPTASTKLLDLGHAVFETLSSMLQTQHPAGIDRSWKKLAAELEFTQNEVSAIGNMHDPVDKFLQHWMQLDGDNCTLGRLFHLLGQIERFDVVDEVKRCSGYQGETPKFSRQCSASINTNRMTMQTIQSSSSSSGGSDVPSSIDRIRAHVERTTELVNQRNPSDRVRMDTDSTGEAQSRMRSLPGSRSLESSRSSVKDTVVNVDAEENDKKSRNLIRPNSTQESEEPGPFHPDFVNEGPLETAQRQEAKEQRLIALTNQSPTVTNVNVNPLQGSNTTKSLQSIDDNDDESIKFRSLPCLRDNTPVALPTEQGSAMEKGMLENIGKVEKDKINKATNVQSEQDSCEEDRTTMSNQACGRSATSTESCESSSDFSGSQQTQVKTVDCDDSGSCDRHASDFSTESDSSCLSSQDQLRRSQNVSNPGVGESVGVGLSKPGGKSHAGEGSGLNNFERFKQIQQRVEASSDGSLDLSSQGQSSIGQPVLGQVLNEPVMTVVNCSQNTPVNNVDNQSAESNECSTTNDDVQPGGVEVGVAKNDEVLNSGSETCERPSELASNSAKESEQIHSPLEMIRQIQTNCDGVEFDTGSSFGKSDLVERGEIPPVLKVEEVKTLGQTVQYRSCGEEHSIYCGNGDCSLHKPSGCESDDGDIVQNNVRLEANESGEANTNVNEGLEQGSKELEVSGAETSELEVGGDSSMKSEVCDDSHLELEASHELVVADTKSLNSEVSSVESSKSEVGGSKASKLVDGSFECKEEDNAAKSLKLDEGCVNSMTLQTFGSKSLDLEVRDIKSKELKVYGAKSLELKAGGVKSKESEISRPSPKTSELEAGSVGSNKLEVDGIERKEINVAGIENDGSGFDDTKSSYCDKSENLNTSNDCCDRNGLEIVRCENTVLNINSSESEEENSDRNGNSSIGSVSLQQDEEVGIAKSKEEKSEMTLRNDNELSPLNSPRPTFSDLSHLNVNNNSGRQEYDDMSIFGDSSTESLNSAESSSSHNIEEDQEENISKSTSDSHCLQSQDHVMMQRDDSSNSVCSMTIEKGAALTKPVPKTSSNPEGSGYIFSDGDTRESGASGSKNGTDLAQVIYDDKGELAQVRKRRSKMTRSKQVVQPSSDRVSLRSAEVIFRQTSVEDLDQGSVSELRHSVDMLYGSVEIIDEFPVRKARISRVQFDTDDEGLSLDEQSFRRHLPPDEQGHAFSSSDFIRSGPKNTASVLQINKKDEMKRSASFDNICPVPRKPLQRISSKEEGDSVGCFPKMSFLGCCTGGKLPKLTSKPFKRTDIYKKWMSFSGSKEGRKSRTTSESDKETVGSNTPTPDAEKYLKEPTYPTGSSNETLEYSFEPSLVVDSGIGTSNNTMLTASRTLSDYSEDRSSLLGPESTPRSRKQRSLTEIFDSLPDGSECGKIDTTPGWDVVWQDGTPVGSLTCLFDETLYHKKKEKGRKTRKSDGKDATKRPVDGKEAKGTMGKLNHIEKLDLESSEQFEVQDGSDSEDTSRDRGFSLDTWISDDIEASLGDIEAVTSPLSTMPSNLRTKSGTENYYSLESKLEMRRKKSTGTKTKDAPKNVPIRFLTSTPVKPEEQQSSNKSVDGTRRKRSSQGGPRITLKQLSPSPENTRSKPPITSPSLSAKFVYENWSPSASRSSTDYSAADNQDSSSQEISASNVCLSSAENVVNLVPGMSSYLQNIERAVVGLTHDYEQQQIGKVPKPISSQTNLKRMSGSGTNVDQNLPEGQAGVRLTTDNIQTSNQRNQFQNALKTELRPRTVSPVKGLASMSVGKAIKTPDSSPSTYKKETDFGETVVTRLVLTDPNRTAGMGQGSPKDAATLVPTSPPGNQTAHRRSSGQRVGVEFGVTPNIIPTTQQIPMTPASAVKVETISQVYGVLELASASSSNSRVAFTSSKISEESKQSDHFKTQSNERLVEVAGKDGSPENTSHRGSGVLSGQDRISGDEPYGKKRGTSAAKMAFLAGNTARDSNNERKYFYRFEGQLGDSNPGESSPSEKLEDQLETRTNEADSMGRSTNQSSSQSTDGLVRGRRRSEGSLQPLDLQLNPKTGAVGGRETERASGNTSAESTINNQSGNGEHGRRRSIGSGDGTGRRKNLRTSQSVDGAFGGQSRVFDIGIGALKCAMTPTGIDIGLKLSSPRVARHMLAPFSERNQREPVSDERVPSPSVEDEQHTRKLSEQNSGHNEHQSNVPRPTLRIEGNSIPKVRSRSEEGESSHHFKKLDSLEEAQPVADLVLDQTSEAAVCINPPVILQTPTSPHDDGSLLDGAAVASTADVSRESLNPGAVSNRSASSIGVDDVGDVEESGQLPEESGISAPLLHSMTASSHSQPNVPPRGIVVRSSVDGDELVAHMNEPSTSLQTGSETRHPYTSGTTLDQDLNAFVLDTEENLDSPGISTGVSGPRITPVSTACELDISASAQDTSQTLRLYAPAMDSSGGGDENNNVDEKMRKLSPETEARLEDLEFEAVATDADSHIQNIEIRNHPTPPLEVVSELLHDLVAADILESNHSEKNLAEEETQGVENYMDLEHHEEEAENQNAEKPKHQTPAIQSDNRDLEEHRHQTPASEEMRDASNDNMSVLPSKDSSIEEVCHDSLFKVHSMQPNFGEVYDVSFEEETDTTTDANLDKESNTPTSLPDVLNLTKSSSFEDESTQDEITARSLPDVVADSGNWADNEKDQSVDSPHNLRDGEDLNQSPKLSFEKYLRSDNSQAVAEEASSSHELTDASRDISHEQPVLLGESIEAQTSNGPAIGFVSSDILNRSEMVKSVPTSCLHTVSKEDVGRETCQLESSPYDLSIFPSRGHSVSQQPLSHANATIETIADETVAVSAVEESESGPASARATVGETADQGVAFSTEISALNSAASGAVQEGGSEASGDTLIGINDALVAIEEHPKDQTTGTDIINEGIYHEKPSEELLQSYQSESDKITLEISDSSIREETLQWDSLPVERGVGSNPTAQGQLQVTPPTITGIKLPPFISSTTNFNSTRPAELLSEREELATTRDVSGQILQFPQQEQAEHPQSTFDSEAQVPLELLNQPNIEFSRDKPGTSLLQMHNLPQQEKFEMSQSTVPTKVSGTLELQNPPSLASSMERFGPILQGACHYPDQEDLEFTRADSAEAQVMNYAQFQEIVSQLDESNQYGIPDIKSELETLDEDAVEICRIIVDEIFNKAMKFIEDREMRIFSAFGIAQRPHSRVVTAAGAVRGHSVASGIMLPGVESRLMPVGEGELDGVEMAPVVEGGACGTDEAATSSGGEVEALDDKGLVKKSVEICKKFAPYAAGSATFGTLAYLMFQKMKNS